MQIELIKELEVQNRLGEGVIWDHLTSSIWWTDILSQKLFQYSPGSDLQRSWPTPEMLACFALVEGDSRVLAGFASGFAYFEPVSGEVEWICKVEETCPETRLNDGRTDRQGRFWAGTMSESKQQNTELGGLYSLDASHCVRRHLSGIRVSNSLCWSPNSSLLYHSDTPNQTIDSYPFEPAIGALGEKQMLVATEGDCYPDGSIVDSQGCVWNAQWGGGKVVRYGPDGVVVGHVELPVSQPTCIAFGGENLDLLIVTSAKEALAQYEPRAGNVFIYQTNVLGINEKRYFSNKYSLPNI